MKIREAIAEMEKAREVFLQEQEEKSQSIRENAKKAIHKDYNLPDWVSVRLDTIGCWWDDRTIRGVMLMDNRDQEEKGGQRLFFVSDIDIKKYGLIYSKRSRF